jgi:hypothetical protein
VQQVKSILSTCAVCDYLMASVSHLEVYIGPDAAPAHGRRYEAPQSAVAAGTVALPLTGNR